MYIKQYLGFLLFEIIDYLFLYIRIIDRKRILMKYANTYVFRFFSQYNFR